MAYCFYNGVKLPELPSDVLATYPYCWIRKNDNTQHYDLIFTKVLGYYDATAGGIVYGENSATAEIAHYRVAYADASTADSWDSYQTTETWMALDANRTVMWSNHYIPNGSLTATEMYFDGSEAIPDAESYEIQKDTLVGIADQVRRLCNTENTMTPAQMESNLGGLNIELEETFVISTESEQTIYPSEGCYGFSKITVGAVDLSSGGSGSGSGSGGYADASGGSFGSLAGENAYTGNYLYNGLSLPALPKDKVEDYPYCYIFTPDDDKKYWLSMCQSPKEVIGSAVQTNASVDYYSINYVIYKTNEGLTGKEWKFWSGPDRYSTSINNTFLWSNYDILYNDKDGVFWKGSIAVAETSPDATFYPIETDEYYVISGSKLNELATAVQNATGATNVMTIDGMILALNAI